MSQRYRAFITYSHADQKIALWLHKKLERFVIPAQLRKGGGRTFAPIFRDRDELSAAGGLNEALKNAIEHSDALIVICSPDAVASQWVDEEIAWFRNSQPEAPIACVIVAGEPGDPRLECFPQTLVTQSGLTDRVAADLRPHHDSRSDALLRVAAGLLGVGFDTLKHRQQHLRIRQLVVINAFALLVTVVVGVLAWVAVVESENSSRRQAQAEHLISFMLGDLRTTLEPIGRLDLLDAVGDEANNYFASLDSADETDAVLLSRVKTLRQVGDIRVQQGRLDEAAASFDQALTLSRALHQRDPQDNDRLFEFSQIEFWLGLVYWRKDDLQGARAHWQQYLNHSETLAARDGMNASYRLEVAFANNNLGTLSSASGDLDQAIGYFTSSEFVVRQLVTEDPENAMLLETHAQVLAWVASAEFESGRLDRVMAGYESQIEIFMHLLERDGANRLWQRMLAIAYSLHGEMLALVGQRELALDRFERAGLMLAELIAHDPTNRDWQRNFGRTIWYLGRIHEVNGDYLTAIESYIQAVDVFSDLLQQDSNRARWQQDYAQSLSSLLRIARLHDMDSMIEHILVSDMPEDPRLACELAIRDSNRMACEKSVAALAELMQARPRMRTRMQCYVIKQAFHTLDQDDAWQELYKMGIQDKDFVNTL